MASTPSFNRFVAIDWSGAHPVSKRAIAVAQMRAGSHDVGLVAPQGRDRWSREGVADWICAYAEDPSGRALIGIDANFSYDAGAVGRHAPGSSRASDLWAAVETVCAGHPDLHGGAYWRHADRASHYWTAGPKPAGFAPHPRLTETVCVGQGLGSPESPFKLLGPKQVGRGGLAVMRLCHHLQERLGDRIAIWPFDPPEAIAAARIVLCEIFPRLFIQRTARRAAMPGLAKLRTSEALTAALRPFGADWVGGAITDHDADALISAAGMRDFFEVEGLSQPPANRQAQIAIEGWIMGLSFPAEWRVDGSSQLPPTSAEPVR